MQGVTQGANSPVLSDAKAKRIALDFAIRRNSDYALPENQCEPDPLISRQRAMKINSNQIKRLTAEEVDQMGLPADVALAVKSNLAVIITLNAQIDELEKRLQEKVGERKEFILLSSVPGIGRILATIILLETGPIERFAAVGNFASYRTKERGQHRIKFRISLLLFKTQNQFDSLLAHSDRALPLACPAFFAHAAPRPQRT